MRGPGAGEHLKRPSRIFSWAAPVRERWSWGDAVALAVVTVVVYIGARLAFDAPAVIEGPAISLSPGVLPLYAGLSLMRMLAAYALSVVFSLIYGHYASTRKHAEQVLLPLLDVLQSVPILSFLPIVLLGLNSFLPENIAVELASIVLIFTSQVWNLTFAWYQSQKTIPAELKEAATVFRLSRWLRFKTLDFPFAAISLVWNSIMSWAGGWFFLMAAEIFTVGRRDFRLPGLGAYLSEAARAGDLMAVSWGVGALITLIVLLDQLVWRPLIAWSSRFKLEMLEAEEPASSWFYDAWRRSQVVGEGVRRVAAPVFHVLDRQLARFFSARPEPARRAEAGRSPVLVILSGATGAVLLYGLYRAAEMLLAVSAAQWEQIGVGLAATGMRVTAAILLALAWTLPVGVVIGTSRRWAAWLQPVAQIAASVPATALFPILLLVLLELPGGLNLIAIVLMLMGTQWYLLFNIIAGATAIPQDLKYTAALLGLDRWQRWRTLTLPALFPYIITGLVTAGGGAWNASIVAEYTEFGGATQAVTGIGSAISRATAAGDYPFLLAATLSMVFAVVLVNRTVWRRLYRAAEERYRMD
jgi:NitT/TauT family transport system permease protein